MDIDKLQKAIQILIREELKKQLPKILKEVVKLEVKRSITENFKTKKNGQKMKGSKTFMDVEVEQEPVIEEKTFSKDPVLNKMLNETYRTYQGAPQEVDESTVSFNSSDVYGGVHGAAPGGLQRASLAAKMGYGDMAMNYGDGPKPGIGAQTGHEHLDKALNRDYTELVKRF